MEIWRDGETERWRDVEEGSSGEDRFSCTGFMQVPGPFHETGLHCDRCILVSERVELVYEQWIDCERANFYGARSGATWKSSACGGPWLPRRVWTPSCLLHRCTLCNLIEVNFETRLSGTVARWRRQLFAPSESGCPTERPSMEIVYKESPLSLSCKCSKSRWRVDICSSRTMDVLHCSCCRRACCHCLVLADIGNGCSCAPRATTSDGWGADVHETLVSFRIVSI